MVHQAVAAHAPSELPQFRERAPPKKPCQKPASLRPIKGSISSLSSWWHWIAWNAQQKPHAAAVSRSLQLKSFGECSSLNFQHIC